MTVLKYSGLLNPRASLLADWMTEFMPSSTVCPRLLHEEVCANIPAKRQTIYQLLHQWLNELRFQVLTERE